MFQIKEQECLSVIANRQPLATISTHANLPTPAATAQQHIIQHNLPRSIVVLAPFDPSLNAHCSGFPIAPSTMGPWTRFSAPVSNISRYAPIRGSPPTANQRVATNVPRLARE
jgi:hypothetical protein